ncbi:MAG TPA: porin family protein [Sphingomicrobium sp.]|nr:porin family protein [Sphingomicrobium sp.]
MKILDWGLALAAVGILYDPAAANPSRTPEDRIVLNASQMLKWAKSAQSRGDSQTAKRVYRAMQQDDNPDVRAEARFNLARLLATDGRLSEAAILLRQVLDEKPAAAPVRMELAQLLVRIGDEAAARRELRALQAGPLPAEAARLVDRFSNALRVRKPFGASVEIALAPDSNINRATRSDTIGTILGPFDISDDGKATSGTGIAVRGQVYGRLPVGGETHLLARLSGDANVYGESDYNELAFEAAAGPELQLGRNVVRIEAGAGRRWFGGDPFVDTARLTGSITRPVGRRAQVQLSGSALLIDNKLNDLQDGRGYTARIGLERALSPTTGIGLALAGDRQALRDAAYSTLGWRASLFGWRDMGRTTLTASAEYGRLSADDRLALFPDKRRETFAKLSFGATFRQFAVNGFAPLVRYSIERNRSSIAIYDYSRRRAEFGVSRAF